MDAEHEIIVEKQDLTGDGKYDSFKYGQTNAAGEITFHTLIQMASYRADNIRKVEDEKENPKAFQLDYLNYINKLLTPNIGWDPEEDEYGGWGDLFEEGFSNEYDIWAKKEIKSESTITSSIERNYYLIQKDIDMDGNPDKEMTYEQSYSTMHAITYTRDKTSIYFRPEVHIGAKKEDMDSKVSDEYIKQYTVSEYKESYTELSIMFRDFESDEVLSSRFYEDVFPNELTELYDLSQYYITAINNGGDSDPFNDIEAQVIDLSPLLTLSHEADNIPAMFDSLRKYENTFTSENILSSLEDVIVPGSQFDLGNFGEFASEVVKIIPRQGVYYDNALQERPELYEGGSYFYIDGDGEGTTYETLFIADRNDNIIGVGFDYDYDHYFTPHKRIIVKNHIRDTFLSEDEGRFSVKNLIQHELLGHYDEDFNGYSLDPTFSDALFDLWKTVRSEGSTALFEEVSQLTFNQFMETLTPERIQVDIVWGTISLVAAMVVGGIVGAAVTAVSGPITGKIAGAVAGMAVYAGLSILKGYNDLKEQENILKAYTYHSDGYKGTKTLSRREYYDDTYGDTMTTGVTGNQYGVYMPVVYETKQNRYEGQIILSPFEYWKTTPEITPDSQGRPQLTSNLNKINVDYYLQSRNYMGYSDLDDKRVEEFFKLLDNDDDAWSKDPNNLYAENSLIYLENAVAQATSDSNDDKLDTVLPYMYDYYPVLTFVDSDQYAGLPEFYEDYPIIVAEDVYEENKETYGKFVKIWDPQNGDGQEIKITPQDAVHMLQSDIEYINIYTLTRVPGSGDYEYREVLHDDEYSFDISSGTILVDSSAISRFHDYIDSEYSEYRSTCIILECFVKQYRSINDSRGLSPEQMKSIATMQSIQASLLEYMMQFQIAVQSQGKLNEIAYTVAITVITTALTLGIGSAFHIGGGSALGLIKEPLEEVFVDPIIEAVATKIVRDLGGDEYAQMIASTLAESGREGLSLRNARSNAQFNQEVKLKMDANPSMTKAEAIRQVKAEINANQQDSSTASKVAKAALMTLSIFGLVLGMGGMFGTGGLGITALSIFFMSHGGGFIDFLERLREQEQINQNEVEVDNFFATTEADEERVYRSKLAFTSQFVENLKRESGLFDVSGIQKPIATIADVQKIGALLQFFGVNIYRTESGLWKQDPHLMALNELMRLGYSWTQEAMVYGGGMAPGAIPNPRPAIPSFNARAGHHREKRLMLKLIHSFFILNSKNMFKLPGYTGQYITKEGEYKSYLKALGETLEDLGGTFYGYKSQSLYEIWRLETSMQPSTVDKLEHFYLYNELLCQETRSIGLEAIRLFRIEKGFITRDISPNKAEWDLTKILQKAYSSELNKYISIAKLGDLLTNDERYFRKSLFRTQILEFRDFKIQDFLIKIQTDLTGDNYKLAESALNRYLQLRQRGKVFSYSVPSHVPHKSELEILNLLREAYTFHPTLNPSPGKAMTFRYLFRNTLGKYTSFRRISKGINPISDKKLDFIYRKARQDLLQFFAPQQYADLMRALNRYKPQFKSYWKLDVYLLSNLKVAPLSNQYPSTWTDRVKRMQRIILGRLFAGKDALTGQPLTSTAHLHHWKFSNPYKKMDCSLVYNLQTGRLPALVPLSASSHGLVQNNPAFEAIFEDALKRVLTGKPPRHWSAALRKQFIKDKWGMFRNDLAYYV